MVPDHLPWEILKTELNLLEQGSGGGGTGPNGAVSPPVAPDTAKGNGTLSGSDDDEEWVQTDTEPVRRNTGQNVLPTAQATGVLRLRNKKKARAGDENIAAAGTGSMAQTTDRASREMKCGKLLFGLPCYNASRVVI